MENDNNQSPAAQEASTQTQTSSCAERLGDELKDARQCCDDMRRKAVESLQNARSTTLGDVFDSVVGFVKRHPRCSLGIAATLGFLVVRLFRR